MKKTVIEYVTDTLEDIPRQFLQANRVRLHAFFSEQETIEKRGTRLVSKYTFYSVEKPRKHTKRSLFKEYRMLCADLRSIQPRQIADMEYKGIVLYGDVGLSVAQEQLMDYLKRNNLPEVCLSFCDKEEADCRKKDHIDYAELQKALFYCKKKTYLLLFVSVRELIHDIRFYDLLEEYRIDFRCVDFPWFCRENLRLIKAVMLYDKLSPETGLD